MLGNFKAIRRMDSTLVVLISLLFVAVAFEREISSAAWITGSVMYMISLLAFFVSAINSISGQMRIDKWSWVAAIYAVAFATFALSVSFEPLGYITALGVASGVLVGLYAVIVSRRALRE